MNEKVTKVTSNEKVTIETSTSAPQRDVCHPPKKICIIGKSESYKYCQDIDQNWNNVFQIIN